MTAFSLIGAGSQYLLVGLLFLAAMCELALCLYQQICRSGRGCRIMDGVLFLVALALCAHTMTAARYRAYHAALPWAAVPLAAALLIDAAALGNAIWHNHPDYAAVYNRDEQNGLHDCLAALLRALGAEEVEPSVSVDHLIRLTTGVGTDYIRL